MSPHPGIHDDKPSFQDSIRPTGEVVYGMCTKTRGGKGKVKGQIPGSSIERFFMSHCTMSVPAMTKQCQLMISWVAEETSLLESRAQRHTAWELDNTAIFPMLTSPSLPLGHGHHYDSVTAIPPYPPSFMETGFCASRLILNFLYSRGCWDASPEHQA